MPDGTLVFDTQIDKKGFQNGMSDLERETDRLGSTFKGTFGGVVASQMFSQGVEMLVDFGKAAVSTASDLAEVQNVVDVTFGQGADTIETFAKTAMTNFGLTELQAKQYSSTIGAMLKSMGLADSEVLSMSQNMTALVGDMASFYNLDHETAFQKLRSGLSGETEPLKQLGINLSVANLEAYALAEGLGKTYDQMTEAERVNLRFSYIMQATSDAQGDFVRTSDGFANQLRIMQGNLTNIAAEVGTELLPVLEEALGYLNSIISGNWGEGSETETKIKGITDAFDSIEDEIHRIQNEYTNTTIKINVDYRTANDLITDIERLRTLEAQGVDVNDELKTASAQLVSLYPQLAEYMGTDGIIAKEVPELRAYNEEMKELARQTAYLQMVAEYEALYGSAEANYMYLSTAKTNAMREMNSLQSRVDLLNQIETQRLGASTLLGQGLEENIDTAETIRLIEAYIDLFGGLEGVDTSKIDLDSIFDEEGNIRADASIFALVDLLAAISSSDVENQTREQYDQAKTELAAAETALTESADAYRTAAEQLTIASQTYNRLFGSDEETPDYMGEVERNIAQETGGQNQNYRMRVGVGAAIEANIEEEREAIGQAVEEAIPDKVEVEIVPTVNLSVWDRIRNFFGGGSTDGSHATGLSRVPYDNYIARLHSGEAVLSAGEAERWRTGGSIDYGAIAAAVAAALPNGGGGVTKLYIDGVELASTQANNNRSALAVRSSMEARGYGKR